ncbi:TPA: hypothetical protein N2D10_003058 [Clostridium botulinum]|nr:hypothetical protein [Clostridium botulinum]
MTKGVTKQELGIDVIEDLNKIGNLSTLEKEIIDSLTNENKEVNITNAINYLCQNNKGGNNDNDGSIKLGTIENLTAISDLEGTKAILTWKNPTITEFQKVEIYVSTQDLTSANYDYCTKNATKIVDDKIDTFEFKASNNTTFYFKAFAVYNIFGTLQNSDGIVTSVKVIDTKPPAIVTNIKATTGNGEITLAWINPNDKDFAKVKIVRKENNNPTDIKDGIVVYEGNNITYKDTSLSNGTNYYYRFFTYDLNNNINYTDTQFISVTPLANGYNKPVNNFTAQLGNTEITLSWTNPVDDSFNKVMIRKKIGSYPSSITDGDLVYEGNNTAYKDIGLTNGTKYCYRAFTFNKNNQYCDVADGQQVDSIPQVFKEYGVRWTKSTDTMERLGDAVGLTAVTGGKNDFNSLMPWCGIRRCNLSDEGIVNAYYGSPMYKLDGSNGQCMVEIPKFWFKIDYISNDIIEFWICNGAKDGYEIHPAFFRDRKHLCNDNSGIAEEVNYRYHHTYLPSLNNNKLESKSSIIPRTSITMDQARSYAMARGNSWGLVDFNLRYAIQLLYLIEYAHFNSQEKIGKGFVSSNDSAHITGGTNNLGNQSGNEADNGIDGKHQVSYRGIEDFWGNCSQWIDGFYYNRNRYIYIGNKGFNNEGKGYTYCDMGSKDYNFGGFISDILPNKKCGFVIKETGGSNSTKLCDSGALHADRLPIAGGCYRSAENGSDYGVFYFYCMHSASNASSDIASSLAF